MLKGYDREVFCIVNFRNDMTPINMNIVSMGTLNASLVHPREILKSSILSNAAHVLAFRNHTSGSLSPSQEDIQITDRLQKLLDLAGIPLLDHIIIGNGDRYYSFGYIAGWSSGKETAELKESLGKIRDAASEMVTEIEAKLTEIEKAPELAAVLETALEMAPDKAAKTSGRPET